MMGKRGTIAFAIALVVAIPANADEPLTYLLKFGTPGSSTGQFYSPAGIATDLAGNVYVADASRNKIIKFTNDGQFISEFGSTGNGNGGFNGAADVSIDAAGTLYVTDSSNGLIQVF